MKTITSSLIKLLICSLLTLQVTSFTFEDCYTFNPMNAMDCLIRSESNFYCCYTTTNLLQDRKCVVVDKTGSKLSPNSFAAFGENINCGAGFKNSNEGFGVTIKPDAVYSNKNKLSLPYYACGTTNPSTANQCTDFSMLNNSCCYWKDALSNGGCYWLGQQFSGKSTVSGFTIECSASFLNSFKLVFALLILLFIF